MNPWYAGLQQIVPVPSDQRHPEKGGCGFDVCKCLGALRIVHAIHLAETRDGAADVAGIRQRLFALAWKGEGGCGQVPARLARIDDRPPGDVHASFIARMDYGRVSELIPRMNAFFDELAATLVAEAKRRGTTIDPPQLEPKTAEELLELARVVSHTRERRFAPLACYVAGIAAARLKSQNSSIDLAELFNAVRLKFEPQEDSSNKSG